MPPSPACQPGSTHPGAVQEPSLAVARDGYRPLASLHAGADAAHDWGTRPQQPAAQSMAPAEPAQPWQQQRQPAAAVNFASLGCSHPPLHRWAGGQADYCSQIGAVGPGGGGAEQPRLGRSLLVRLAQAGPSQQPCGAGAAKCRPPLKLLRPGGAHSAAGPRRPYSARRYEDRGVAAVAGEGAPPGAEARQPQAHWAMQPYAGPQGQTFLALPAPAAGWGDPGAGLPGWISIASIQTAYFGGPAAAGTATAAAAAAACPGMQGSALGLGPLPTAPSSNPAAAARSGGLASPAPAATQQGFQAGSSGSQTQRLCARPGLNVWGAYLATRRAQAGSDDLQNVDPGDPVGHLQAISSRIKRMQVGRHGCHAGSSHGYDATSSHGHSAGLAWPPCVPPPPGCGPPC
jgi:hypothetical protein